MSAMTKIKAIIVDDIKLFRMGIRTAIESGVSNAGSDSPQIEVVGEAKSGAEFFEMLKTTPADIVLLDIMMPGMSGFEVARRLKKEYPDVKILAISAEASDSVVQDMLHIGVDGFIYKLSYDDDSIAQAIHSIMSGIEYFGTDIATIIYRIFVAKKKTAEVTSEFSEQEKRIIELCRDGLIAKEIADRLGIAAKTVNWHKQKIFERLGINNTAEMVNYALKNGIIRTE
jgi:DNA-binding NarL/FixJ family response regulator